MKKYDYKCISFSTDSKPSKFLENMDNFGKRCAKSMRKNEEWPTLATLAWEDYIIKQFKKLGEEGWELVSVCPISNNETTSDARQWMGLDLVCAFFKKEIE